MKYTFLYAFGKFLTPLLRILMPIHISHAENLPKEGPVVVCCNHAAYKDPIMVSLACHRQVRYMAKAELFQNKLIGKLLKGFGAFPIHRGQGDSDALKVAREILKKGEVLGIFIEGTRSRTGKLGKPKPGAVMLAYETNSPVLPVCITAKDGKQPRLLHRANISFGELIPPEGLGIREPTAMDYRRASRLVMDKIQELRDQDEAWFHRK